MTLSQRDQDLTRECYATGYMRTMNDEIPQILVSARWHGILPAS